MTITWVSYLILLYTWLRSGFINIVYNNILYTKLKQCKNLFIYSLSNKFKGLLPIYNTIEANLFKDI